MEVDCIWTELGIPPTQEQAAIRRAYAARLKSIRPDVDPQGFAKLRQAYERALGTSTRPFARPMVAPKPSPMALMETRPEPLIVTPTTPAAEPLSEPQAKPAIVTPTEDGVSQGLCNGDVVAAADWLVKARERGALSLQQDMRLTDTLAWSMAQDRSLSGEAVLDAADRLGWSSANLVGLWAKALQTRLEAELWLSALRRDAAASRWLFAEPRTVAARILLGTGPWHGWRSRGARPILRRLYGEFLLYATIIGHRLDSVRIEAVGKSVMLSKRQAVLRGWWKQVWHSLRLALTSVFYLFSILLYALMAGGLAGEIQQSWSVPVMGVVAVALIVWLIVWKRRRRRRFLERNSLG